MVCVCKLYVNGDFYKAILIDYIDKTRQSWSIRVYILMRPHACMRHCQKNFKSRRQISWVSAPGNSLVAPKFVKQSRNDRYTNNECMIQVGGDKDLCLYFEGLRVSVFLIYIGSSSRVHLFFTFFFLKSNSHTFQSHHLYLITTTSSFRLLWFVPKWDLVLNDSQ